MSIQGYRDYRRREYCNDVKCQIQLLLNRQEAGSDGYERLRQVCKTNCLCTTYEFHHWLIDKGFIVIKRETNGG